MKKLTYYLSLLLLLNSCNKPELNELEKDLFDKVVGRWEVVSFRETGYSAYDPDDPNDIVNQDNLLHKNYFHISDVKDPANENYIKAMLFEEGGDITIESNLSEDWRYASWKVKNEQLQIDFLWMEETELTIHSFTDDEFHMTLEHLIDHKWVDDDGISHRRLTLRIEEWVLNR